MFENIGAILAEAELIYSTKQLFLRYERLVPLMRFVTAFEEEFPARSACRGSLSSRDVKVEPVT